MKYFAVIFFIGLLFSVPAKAQNKIDKDTLFATSDSEENHVVFIQQLNELSVAISLLTKAMIDADSVQLYALTYPSLKYAHSTGLVQNQKEFVEGITSGRSDFLSIDLSNQTVDIVGNTACVRHILTAKTFDNKVPGNVKLAILLVWAKQNGKWRLLARQAVKPQE